MGSRRKAREAAVQMLYQMDVSGVDAERAITLFWENLSETAPNARETFDEREFADGLVRGYGAQRDAIDDKIREVSKHWRLERMSRVDRNIIRLGAYELLHVSDVPRRVTLNEAVELAKRFGNEESPSFVNGVLDRIAADLSKE
jgi:N utilization substance protein B